MSLGVFAEWQPRYAAANIPTFPVRNKKPAVRGYLKLGLTSSQKLSERFGDASAFGFACRRAGVTVVDVDSQDESVLADALTLYGDTPIIVRSGSNHFQAWYRNGGETRQIRPDRSKPIDILGDGYVVAPPSRGIKGQYEFLSGSLDDLADLPSLKWDELNSRALSIPHLINVGQRNQSLWRAAMQHAHSCSSFDDVLRFVHQTNVEMTVVPLPDAEVLSIARSAWERTCAGENRFGRGQVIQFHRSVFLRLAADPDCLVLLGVLMAHNWARQEFFVANDMCKTMPRAWSRKRFAAARSSLIRYGLLKQVRPASLANGPALYCFPDRPLWSLSCHQ